MAVDDLRRAAAQVAAPAPALDPDLDPDLDPATIFISYARQDTAVVEDLVARLRLRGASIVWDKEFTSGLDFETQIRCAIDNAACVIVVWSAVSAQSDYVRDEAKLAHTAGKLVITHVEGFDFGMVPLGFGRLHAVPVGDTELIVTSLARRGIPLRMASG